MSQPPRRQYKSRSPSPHHHRHSNKPGLCFLSQSLWRWSMEVQNALFVLKPGKLKSGELSTAHSPQDLWNNRAYFITDSRFQARCLVDTGAAYCIWPLKLHNEKPPSIAHHTARGKSLPYSHVRSNFSFSGLGIMERFYMGFYCSWFTLPYSRLGLSAPLQPLRGYAQTTTYWRQYGTFRHGF